MTGVLSKVITYSPLHNADDPLAYAADHSATVATGALLVLAMGLSLAMVPVVLFPVLRRVDEVLATGYLIIRRPVLRPALPSCGSGPRSRGSRAG